MSACFEGPAPVSRQPRPVRLRKDTILSIARVSDNDGRGASSNRGELTVNMAEIASGRHVNGISLRFLGLCKGGQDVRLKPFWAAGLGG